MEWEIKKEVINCEVDESNEEGVGLIHDRSDVVGTIKRFLAYNQVGAYTLPKNHGLRKGDMVILTRKIVIHKIGGIEKNG